jgi:hypothetical protein
LNKKVLIISPHFPPLNAADMQRVRMSLSYFKQYGWEAEMVTVDDKYSEIVRDELLIQSVPADIKIHKVKAFSKKITSKFGLGNLALRSLWHYYNKVNQLLGTTKYDLIYFSTTQFPITILGPYWKTRFKVPYVIDMQDPWHSNYYINKPKSQQPKKYWFSYRLNKYLESVVMKKVDGLIAVSDNYIHDLKARYPSIKNVPSATITFGAFEPDLKIAKDNKDKYEPLLNLNYKNIVYIGRGGMDMHKAIAPIFTALKNGLTDQPNVFSNLRLYFIGTSYAPAGKGVPTILPLAKQYNVENNIIEITDRISFYHTLLTLEQSDGLFIPGSDDSKYTASKIYPYLLIAKPLLSIFNKNSSAISILHEYGVKHNYSYDSPGLDDNILQFLQEILAGINITNYNPKAVKKYSAQTMTQRQCVLFNLVINGEI